MAVEKMELMNVVSHQDHQDEILRKIAQMENVHLIDAVAEINESNFTLNMLEEHLDEIVNMCLITAYRHDQDFKRIQDELEYLMGLMDLDMVVDPAHFQDNYLFHQVEGQIQEIFEHFKELRAGQEEAEEELGRLRRFSVVEALGRLDIDLKQVYDMEHFTVKLGTLTKESRNKLSMNYENVSAAVMHVGGSGDEQLYLVVSPTSLDTETDRILRSVYFQEIEVLQEYLGPVSEMVDKLKARMAHLEASIEEREEKIRHSKAEYADQIACCYSRTRMEQTVSKLKTKTACSSSFFYLSGWVSETEKEAIQQTLEDIGYNIIIGFKSLEELDGQHTPPTKLRNNWLLRPFELLVNMYGTPSYTELDPTTFLGLTYMFLFGAMFGDLGQGLLFILAGTWITRRNPANQYGAILSRLGISSMVFGLLYDSFFGYEHVISGLVERVTGSHALAEALFLRPIENINTILISSLVLGIGLLAISYGYSVVNKLRNKDYKEGLFGRTGLTGFILFAALLTMAMGFVSPLPQMVMPLLIGIVLIAIALIVVREPLTNLILGNRPLYHESPNEYYVESGFEILETFLSMLSNTMSFIRVGAFALNHVGLFIAFHTMANIIGNFMGDVSMFIVGNLLVIFLEGLIVFIQGLRLVYYELFSKYYTGDGVAFQPATVHTNQ